ncbi:hypothetical protein A8C32_12525 [Flavivirga aquatica]|uniref:Uncharacterized protein n=1 Tax=Flavivirga aquatica TaxID=1849968 RepID=A0A1E5TDW4_9FLAO|nr:hypothetical protein [Flavivirga aquatica]OEK09527.1 hypothetical protein A8C32_12525 [Flavivirga aquatica]
MNKIIPILLLTAITISCSTKNKTDNELLEKDKKELVENLDSYKVSSYKFGKILIRASAEKDTISSEFASFKSDLDRIFNKAVKYNTESLSVLDYISIYRDYKRMEDFIMKTDEDIFPTLVDAFNVAYGDSINKRKEYFTEKRKNMSKILNILF